MQTHGVSHGLAIQPSGYGFDNSALLDALRRCKKRLKGIAVVAADIAETELTRLADGGIVGIRFNLIDFDPQALEKKGMMRLLQVVRDMDWFVDIQSGAADFEEIIPLIRSLKVRVLIDHLARPDPRLGADTPGFREILALADSGLATVKLSGPFRQSQQPYPYADLDSLVQALLDAYTTENCVWGSDWPFLNLATRPRYQQTLACLDRWLPDAPSRGRVLWETPANLFGFKRSKT
jgi:predicted TIM-barrel fold metal-dependent hydrolase